MPQQSYLLERSADLIFWLPEAIVDADLGGKAGYDAGPISATSHRFYRATLPP